MTARFAAAGDAEDLLAIYAQYIDTPVTFETVLPSADVFRGRIKEISAFYPYLVLEEEGKIVGYAYAHRHMARAAYGWNAELSVYLDGRFFRAASEGNYIRRSSKSALYRASERYARALRFPTRGANGCTNRSLSAASAFTAIRGLKAGHGATWPSSKRISLRIPFRPRPCVRSAKSRKMRKGY